MAGYIRPRSGWETFLEIEDFPTLISPWIFRLLISHSWNPSLMVRDRLLEKQVAKAGGKTTLKSFEKTENNPIAAAFEHSF